MTGTAATQAKETLPLSPKPSPHPAPYEEKSAVKGPRFLAELNALTAWHAENCPEYARILQVLYPQHGGGGDRKQVPFLPVRLFKMLPLASVPYASIVKTLTSSGTTSEAPSQVFLDKATASGQSRALVAIARSFLGTRRLPMAIVDHPGVLHDRTGLSARAAGILGFSQFGYEPVYLLDQALSVRWAALHSFVERTAGQTVFLFGFTFMVWSRLYQECVRRQCWLDFGDSILIHGGGWKKLAEQSVSNLRFRHAVSERLGIRRVHNYYGMAEQAGSIFMECEAGYFHASAYSDVLTRHPDTLEVLPFGALGLLEVRSNLPRSYPGHALLSEDLGVIAGEDDCRCGRAGRYFTVQGRLPQAELRGCSDTRGDAG